MPCSGSPTQFEPKLEPHNETMVHHILVYACGNASALPTGISDCYGADPAFSLCSQVIVGWAVGGTVSPVMGEIAKGMRGVGQPGLLDRQKVGGGDGGGLGRGPENKGRPWLPAPSSQSFPLPNLPPSTRVTSFRMTWASLLGRPWTPSGSDWRFIIAIFTIFPVSA